MEFLTNKEIDTLNAICNYIEKHGFPPSTRELGNILGNSSPATVNHKLKKLKAKGYITWVEGKFRTLKVLKRL